MIYPCSNLKFCMICRAPDKRGIEDNSKIIFLINKNVCYGPSFEPCRRDSSNDG